MKITYVHANPMPAAAANTINVARMCAAMAEAGHEVTLVCRRGSGASRDVHEFYGVARNYRVHAVDAPWLPDRLLFLLALAGHRLRGGDVFYARNVLAAHVATSLGVATVLELHTPPSRGRSNRRRFSAAARRRTLKRVLANSPATLADAAALAAPREGLCVLAPHGVEVGAEPRARLSGARLRACYAGSFFAGRGIELLLDVAERTPEIDYWLIGADPAQKALMEQTLRERGIANARVFDRVEPARVAELLSECDVCLAPYQRQVYLQGANQGQDSAAYMSPLKLFDYMPSGCAIVASDLPAISCILEDGVSGLLCDPNDPGRWAAALQALATDLQLRRRLGAGARSLAVAKYSWPVRVAAALEGLR